MIDLTTVPLSLAIEALDACFPYGLDIFNSDESISPEWLIVSALATYPKTPEYVLIELSNTHDLPTLHAIAKHPNTPPHTVSRILRDLD